MLRQNRNGQGVVASKGFGYHQAKLVGQYTSLRPGGVLWIRFLPERDFNNPGGGQIEAEVGQPDRSRREHTGDRRTCPQPFQMIAALIGAGSLDTPFA